MPFIAKYPGDCVLCNEDVQHQEVEYTEDRELVHVFCPEDVDQITGRPLPVCPHCFLVLPRLGVCSCRE